jgi:hypothetical protein
MDDLETEARWLRNHATGCGTEWHNRADALFDLILEAADNQFNRNR